ncbi:MAG: hypothetical protein WAT71_12315 [Ignavibacteria bacterium]
MQAKVSDKNIKKRGRPKKEKKKVLFLKDKNSSCSIFGKYLLKEYDTDIYSYILPTKAESDLGNLNFIDDTFTEQSVRGDFNITNILTDWKSFTANYILQEYGIENSEKLPFKSIMKIVFEKFGYGFNDHENLKTIIDNNANSDTNLVLNKIEKDYDLVIIENLATLIEVSNVELRNLILYRINPSLLKELLKKGVTVLHLLNYDEQIFDFSSDDVGNFKRTLEKIGISSFATERFKDNGNIFDQFLQGIDKDETLESFANFKININEDYLDKLPTKFHFLFEKMKTIYIRCPLQLSADRKENVFLTGNQTTKLSMVADTLYDIMNDIYKQEDSIPTFGMINTDGSNSVMTLSGNIISDSFFSKSKCSNKKLTAKIINFLLSGIKFPEIIINIGEGIVYIDGIELKISKMRFSYYLLFLELAKNKEGAINVVEPLGSKYFVKVVNSVSNDGVTNINAEKTGTAQSRIKKTGISKDFLDRVVTYYLASFPDDDNVKRLTDKFEKNEIPGIESTFNSHFSKINSAVSNLLKNKFHEDIIDCLKIKKTGSGDNLCCKIVYPPDMIKII